MLTHGRHHPSALVGGSGSKSGATDGGTFPHQESDVQGLDVSGDVGAADEVEHHVHAASAGGLLDLSNEVLLAIVDGFSDLESPPELA